MLGSHNSCRGSALQLLLLPAASHDKTAACLSNKIIIAKCACCVWHLRRKIYAQAHLLTFILHYRSQQISTDGSTSPQLQHGLQVGQVILTLPNAFATTGMASGVFFQLIFATLALWTLFLLATLYQELKKRKAAWRRDLHHGIIMVQHLCQSNTLVHVLHHNISMPW